VTIASRRVRETAAGPSRELEKACRKCEKEGQGSRGSPEKTRLADALSLQQERFHVSSLGITTLEHAFSGGFSNLLGNRGQVRRLKMQRAVRRF